MLVLSRYRDESIVIGDDVVVTVVDVRGDRVRLGIQAPSHISVHRREVYDAIAKEKNADQGGNTGSKGEKKSPPAPTEPSDPTLGLDTFGPISQ